MMDRILALTVLALVLGVPLGVIFLVTGQFLMDFVFFYPLFMSGLWMAGGLYFWLHWERRWPWEADTLPPALAGEPLISILIPCFNEGANVGETIEAALAQHYPNIEVIAINDGSKDNTGQLLDGLALLDPRLRVIHLAQNQGKAVALRMAPWRPAASIWCALMATPCWHRTRRPTWWRRCWRTPAWVP